MKVVLADVAEAIARAGQLACDLDLEAEDGRLTVTIDIVAGGLFARSLHDDLQWLVDVAAVREFAHRYGIDPSRLEAFLQRKGHA